MNDQRFIPEQPSIGGLVERMSDELGANAVVLLHENGQVLQKGGWIDDRDYPAITALVAAMIATGRSLGSLNEKLLGSPTRFACDSDQQGIYTVAVAPEIWLAVLYEQPLNPGLFRMKVRRYADTIKRLGVQKPNQWEVAQSSLAPGANLPPVSSDGPTTTEILTSPKSTLFGDITDEEIDDLFENARS